MDCSKLVAHPGVDCRKLVAHLGVELHNLRREFVVPFRQVLEFCHASFQLFYSAFNGLLRHATILLRSGPAVAT